MCFSRAVLSEFVNGWSIGPAVSNNTESPPAHYHIWAGWAFVLGDIGLAARAAVTVRAVALGDDEAAEHVHAADALGLACGGAGDGRPQRHGAQQSDLGTDCGFVHPNSIDGSTIGFQLAAKWRRLAHSPHLHGPFPYYVHISPVASTPAYIWKLGNITTGTAPTSTVMGPNIRGAGNIADSSSLPEFVRSGADTAADSFRFAICRASMVNRAEFTMPSR